MEGACSPMPKSMLRRLRMTFGCQRKSPPRHRRKRKSSFRPPRPSPRHTSRRVNGTHSAARMKSGKESRLFPFPGIRQDIPVMNSARKARGYCSGVTPSLLKAEAVANPGPTHTNNTGAYIHRMRPSTVNTAAQGSARTVRVQIVTPPGVLSRAGQKQLVAEATEIVARISGDPTQAGRTWVLLTEAAEGGWGIAGTAFGKEEFAALAAKKK